MALPILTWEALSHSPPEHLSAAAEAAEELAEALRFRDNCLGDDDAEVAEALRYGERIGDDAVFVIDALGRLRVALGAIVANAPSDAQPPSAPDDATLERIASGDGSVSEDVTYACTLAAEVIALRARAERAEVAYSTLLRAAREHLAAVDAVGSAVDPRGEPTRGDLALSVALEAEHSAAARLRTLLGEG